eukprot:m.281179 g.281179  ORF g.281179 m.281179 type:complete len:437 (-) comp19402_c1_seq5:40-1350(-)
MRSFGCVVCSTTAAQGGVVHLQRRNGHRGTSFELREPAVVLWGDVSVWRVILLLNPSVTLPAQADEPRGLVWPSTAVVNFVEARLLNDRRLLGAHTPTQIDGHNLNPALSKDSVEFGKHTPHQLITLTVLVYKRGGDKDADGGHDAGLTSDRVVRELWLAGHRGTKFFPLVSRRGFVRELWRQLRGRRAPAVASRICLAGSGGRCSGWGVGRWLCLWLFGVTFCWWLWALWGGRFFGGRGSSRGSSRGRGWGCSCGSRRGSSSRGRGIAGTGCSVDGGNPFVTVSCSLGHEHVLARRRRALEDKTKHATAAIGGLGLCLTGHNGHRALWVLLLGLADGVRKRAACQHDPPLLHRWEKPGTLLAQPSRPQNLRHGRVGWVLCARFVTCGRVVKLFVACEHDPSHKQINTGCKERQENKRPRHRPEPPQPLIDKSPLR